MIECRQPAPLRVKSFAAEGRPGASAYELALRNGYVGTEAEWLLSLKGEPGDGLPAVTAADNGRLLRVVNAAWELVSPDTLFTDGNEVSY